VLGTGSDKIKAAVELTGRSEKLGKKEIRASLVFLVSALSLSWREGRRS
jgi:peroxin-12